MRAEDIRKTFLEFFEANGHVIVPSAPLLPRDDPTLLFINAGMNQFKDIFLGKIDVPYPRAASVQKCIRVSGKHNDLEEVGKDTYHHTFFEMLGNWSFGDYFKEGAIEMAWELITKHYRLPEDRLWITIYKDDDEAGVIWNKKIGVPKERILRFGEKDNFWEMGEVGPCGPCTEIHYDFGEEAGCDKVDCRPNCTCGRFVEIWNLVFIQYNRDETGKLTELPMKSVDTGMGFERLVAILQGKKSNYETDIFMPLIRKIEEITLKSFEDNENKVAFRVLSDHVRALAFAIADGVLPSNEGRGYVLRRILRRGARFSRKLGYHDPILYKLTGTLVDTMGDTYPELLNKAEHVSMVIQSEEERFGETLDTGLELFEQLVEKARKEDSQVIWGEDAFKLYDTYGFPVDLTQLMADENGLVVDMKGFNHCLDEQRTRSRTASQFEVKHEMGKDQKWKIISEGGNSDFVGYERNSIDTKLRKYYEDDDRVFLVLEKTPFYAESGGQVGDTGEIHNKYFKMAVRDTKKTGEEIVHIGELLEGRIGGDTVSAVVDEGRRLAIARNHTSTHLLQYALRKVLGDHVQQSGSHVGPDRLRFDYTHFQQPDKEELVEVERLVNEAILQNHPVAKCEENYSEAVKSGALAFFGEKYGSKVRVVNIEGVSRELCGGTHLDYTGQIGSFIIYSESSVAAGVRRIEAYTGFNALDYLQKFKDDYSQLVNILKTKPDEIRNRVLAILEENKSLEREIESLQAQIAGNEVDDIIKDSEMVEDSHIVVAEIPVDSRDKLLAFGDAIKEKLTSGVAVLGAKLTDNSVGLVAVVTQDIVEKRGIKANDLIKKVSEKVDGSGGGRDTFAQAGGSKVENLNEALEYAKKHLVHEMVK
ncbi:alanine--tRNA ligase [bacterium]|nr:alanine--tRNA ligase [bacterium]